MVLLDPKGHRLNMRSLCAACPHRNCSAEDGEERPGYCPGDLGDASEYGCPLLGSLTLLRDYQPDAPDAFLAEPVDGFAAEREEVPPQVGREEVLMEV